jgi:hypothetical protein
MIYIDPDGNKIVFAKNVSKKFKSQFKEAIQYLNNNKIGSTAAKLEKSKIVYTITEGNSGYQSSFNTKTKTITWSPSDGLLNPETGTVISPTTILNHELGHADNYDKAMQSLEAAKQYNENNRKDASNPYGSKEEQSVITGIEQKTAKALGEIKEGEVTRINHGGIPVPTEGVTSNKIHAVEITAPKPIPATEY